MAEFSLNNDDFAFFCRLVLERTGIVLNENKRVMVYSRLVRRLRALGLANFSDYGKILESGDEAELEEFTNALTTNVTHFFREDHHFKFIAEKVLPDLMNKQREVRIWSAGCSTGQEPYTLAMVASECAPSGSRCNVRILATDIDSDVLETARKGIYPSDKVDGVSAERMKRWFSRGRGEHEGSVRIAKELREMVTFKPLNLMKKWRFRRPLDMIFCRNVVIYFDKETQKRLFAQFAENIVVGGYLFIGHSESLYGVSNRFEMLGQSVYRKCA